MTDESSIAWVFWIVLIVAINAIWIGMDLWLRAHNHELLTREIREVLAGGSWRSLLVAAFTGATFGIVMFHFFFQR